MTITAWLDGWRRVLAAPAIIGGVFVVTLLAALPLTLTMRGLIETQLGRSLMADQAADGVNWPWWHTLLSTSSPASSDAMRIRSKISGNTYIAVRIGVAAR